MKNKKMYSIICEEVSQQEIQNTNKLFIAGGASAGMLTGYAIGKSIANKRYKKAVEELEDRIAATKNAADKAILRMKYIKLTADDGLEFKRPIINTYAFGGGGIGAVGGGALAYRQMPS